MNTAREQMFQRISEAVATGNRAGGSPALPERGAVGYQGADGDVVERFRAEFAAAGGHTHIVPDHAAAAAARRVMQRRAPDENAPRAWRARDWRPPANRRPRTIPNRKRLSGPGL